MQQTGVAKKMVGVEVLRIFATFLIALIHTLNQGGILEKIPEGTVEFYIFKLLEAIAMVCVNCYGLISGYVGINSRFKISRFLKIWFEVIFYTLLITFIFALLEPGSVNRGMWVKSLFPITSRVYWYLSCYMGLLLFMPIINAGLKSLGKRELLCIFWGLAAFFCILPFAVKMYPVNVWEEADPFTLAGGYSLLWLLILYIFGGCIKLTGLFDKISTAQIALAYGVSLIVAWMSASFLPDITKGVFGEERYAGLFVTYLSPFELIMGISLLVLFARIKIDGGYILKIILTVSKTTLGIYIIHTHPLVFDSIIKNYGVGFLEKNVGFEVVLTLFGAVLIFIIGMIIDFARQAIFKGLRIERLFALADEKINFGK